MTGSAPTPAPASDLMSAGLSMLASLTPAAGESTEETGRRLVGMLAQFGRNLPPEGRAAFREALLGLARELA